MEQQFNVGDSVTNGYKEFIITKIYAESVKCYEDGYPEYIFSFDKKDVKVINVKKSHTELHIGDIVEQNSKLCTCGCYKLYGEDYPLDKHSSWCDLQEKD